MEFKGTKGEWKNRGESSSLVDIGTEEKGVAYVYKINNESEANAKLIACAPLMLERMKEALKVIDWYMENTKPDNGYETFFNIGANEIEELKHLINKATL